MRFIDKVKLWCSAGAGGAGIVHFRREKYVSKGGPDGGDGGRGGNILVKGNKNLGTLWHLRRQHHFKADKGQDGQKAKKTGQNGTDIIIEVPLGTSIKTEGSQLVAEILEDNAEVIVLKGGRGGRGNWHFSNSKQQTPRYAQPGLEGAEMVLIFELKLLADVGLVGYPNAGKSTLLAHLSKAKPQIAAYPFTTLVPNLGVVPYDTLYAFTMADIPGLIDGASQGKGLGTTFLQHIEHNRVLVFVIDINETNLLEAYQALLQELKNYNPELLLKPRLLAFNKIDALPDEVLNQHLGLVSFKKLNVDYCFISAVSGAGLKSLKAKIWQLLQGRARNLVVI